MESIAKALIVFGGVMVLAGIFLGVAHKSPFLGRLPGDIYVHKKNFSFYLPLTTSILVSLLVSLIFWLFGRRAR